MKKKILLVLLVLATVLPAGAVLKEANMEQTLGVLCEELSEAHKKQRERAKRFEQRNKQFQRSIGRDLELCNNIELMLYSQNEQNVFDLAYACGQATSLYERVSRTRSFKQFEQQQYEQIPHGQKIVQVFVRFDEDDSLIIVGIAVFEQQMNQIGHEEDEKGDSIG
jgi:hypothetical protein